MVRLVSDAKLAAADRLLKEEIGYQVIPRTDPLLTGSETASDLLRREANQYARGFYGALLFTLPLALLTMVFAKVPALGSHALKQYVGSTGFRVIDLVAFTLATPVQFVFGFRFYRGSFYALKRARANMDVLIALGTTIAYAFSIVIPILNTVQIRKGLDITTEIMAFETSALLITIVLLGKWMQSIAKRKTAVGIEALAKLAPRSVTVVSEPPAATELFPQPVDPELVSIGDFFRVNPGASFPLDGVVEQGCTHVDESMLTGESWPVEKAAGHQVYSGTINKGNSVIVRCSATGTDSMLEKIVDLVKRAQASRAPVEAFADRVSAVFVPVVLVIALFATLLWFTLAKTNAIPSSWADGEGDFLFGVLFGLSVLVIACPCALGLATPTVIMMAASVGARKFGILYKDGGEALQAAHKAKAVLFDKTGTLTMGKPIVTCAVPVQIGQNDVSLISNSSAASSIASDFICSIAAAESHSDHPLARALCAYAENHSTADSIEIVTKDSESLAGRGIRCRLEDNRTVVVGKQEWVIEEMQSHTKRPMRLSSACDSMISQWEQVGRTVVWAFVSDNQAAIFGIEDPVRSESRSVIHELRKRGMECGIVTGDSIGTAQNVARIVGIDECDVYARALPTEKVEVVRKLSCRSVKKGSHQDGKDGVVFVGDGINDAGALSAASVGIAMGCGTQIATESAGIVLVKSNLRDVIIALDLARVAFHRIKLNYVWALGFNCLGIPLAAGAAFPLLQTRIPPYAAAAAMGLSSVAVVLCSLSLGLYRAPNLAEQEPNQEPTVSAT